VKTFPEAALRLMEAAVAGEQAARKIQVAHAVECWCPRCEEEAYGQVYVPARPQLRRNPVFRRILSVALVVAVTLFAQRNWDWIEARAVQCGLKLYDRYFGVPPTGNLARTLLELMGRTDAWQLGEDGCGHTASGIAVGGGSVHGLAGKVCNGRFYSDDTALFTEAEQKQIEEAWQRLHADLVERRNDALAQRLRATFAQPAGAEVRQTLPNVAPPATAQYVLPTYAPVYKTGCVWETRDLLVPKEAK
jgi:hypothetical protein